MYFYDVILIPKKSFILFYEVTRYLPLNLEYRSFRNLYSKPLNLSQATVLLWTQNPTSNFISKERENKKASNKLICLFYNDN